MALAIDRYPLGPFQANCYVVRADRGAADAAVIDPGAQGAELRLELARLGTRCAGILVTHTDLDHIGAVAELAAGTDAEVWCPADEADVLRDPTSIGRAGGVPPYDPEHLVVDGDTVEVAAPGGARSYEILKVEFV